MIGPHRILRVVGEMVGWNNVPSRQIPTGVERSLCIEYMRKIKSFTKNPCF